MAITIGFEDEVVDNTLSEMTEQKKQEIVTKAKKVMIKIPERRIPEILQGFDCVVVNTFDDDYHSTDEEREAKNRFVKDANRIRKMKRIYRRLDEYVIAVREHLKFLDIVAEGNGVYDPEEFKKMFFKGKINIVGMRFPKYKGSNRKEINYDYLTEFILSDADPEEILPKWQRRDYIEEDVDDIIGRLVTPEELEFITTPLDKEQARYEYEVFNAGEDNQDGTNVAVAMTNKESKKLAKTLPEIVYKLKEMKRARNTVDRLNDAFLHNTVMEELDNISAYDANYSYVSKSDVPEFIGDVLNDKDYYKYMQKLDEFENNNIYVNYHGKEKTVGEVKELELKEILEKDDWNIRNFAENKIQEKKMKKIQKRDKKKERQLKKHLMALQKRRESRLNGGDEIKKSKKKSKKKSDKKSKKETKSSAKNTMENILMSAAGAKESSFKEYKERALDLTGLFGNDDE